MGHNKFTVIGFTGSAPGETICADIRPSGADKHEHPVVVFTTFAAEPDFACDAKGRRAESRFGFTTFGLGLLKPKTEPPAAPVGDAHRGCIKWIATLHPSAAPYGDARRGALGGTERAFPPPVAP